MIKNLAGDILDILDNQGEKNDNIKQKIEDLITKKWNKNKKQR